MLCCWHLDKVGKFNKTQSKYMVNVLYLWLIRQEHQQPQQDTFSSWTRTCFEIRKEIVVSSETLMAQELYHILSCLCCFPELDNHLHWRWSHGRRGQDGESQLLFRELKAPGVGEVPVIKSAELVVFSVLTVLVRTKHIRVWTTKYQLCNFGEPVHELNAYLFA